MKIEDQASEVLKSELMRDRSGKFYISKNFDFLYEGIENFKETYERLFSGDKNGKLVLKVIEEY